MWKKYLQAHGMPTEFKELNPWGTDAMCGDLSDSVETIAILDESAKKFLPTQTLAASSTVDNRNGLVGNTTVTLTYQYTDTVSTTHTVSHSVKTGVAFEYKVSTSIFGIRGDATTKFSFDYTFTSTDSSTKTESTTRTMTQQVAVNVPLGKVYKAVLLGNVQSLDIPFRANIRVSGGTGLNVIDPSTGGTFMTAHQGVGLLFSGYGDPQYIEAPFVKDQPNRDYMNGFVIGVAGKISATHATEFHVQIWDITSRVRPPIASPGGPAGASLTDRIVALPGDSLMPKGAKLVSSSPPIPARA
jgi:hypothetical protein